jgi:type II secretory pathway component GspD/PulD (secretin)
MMKAMRILGLTTAVGMIGGCLMAEAQGDDAKARDARIALCNPATVNSLRTFYFANASQPNEMNEIQTALRQYLPPDSSKVYLTPSQGAITVCAAPDQMALTEKLLHDLDRPHKSYRLTFTMTESDAGKRVGTQHYTLIVRDGMRTTVKQGSKIPIVTGSTGAGGAAQTQFQYLDIGINFDTTLSVAGNSGELKAKVEQSSAAEDHLIAGVQEPVVRQSVFEGNAELTMGKPLILSSIDVPGSTRHVDLDVMMEPVP